MEVMELKYVKKTPLELFEESLNKMSDEDFAKLLDEMENDPEGCGITIGEFVERFTFSPNKMTK